MQFFFRAAALLLCILCMAGIVQAEGFDNISGICLTELPDSSTGLLTLGSRVLRPGDVLTAKQAESMTFSPRDESQDCAVQVSYLPITPEGTREETVMTISIRGKADQPPIAQDSAGETYKNLELTGKLLVSDPENTPMTFAVVRQPKRGTVEIHSDGSFVYTPKKNKIGIDSFTFTAADAGGKLSREATVTITILKPGSAQPYTDTAGRKCCFAAEWMKHTGIFTGENVGGRACFSPDKEVSRGQFLTMLVKELDIPTDEEVTVTGYTDVPGWLQPYLAAAVRSGLTLGLPASETFLPEEAMDADTAATLLCNGLKLEAVAAMAGEEPVSAVTILAESGIVLEPGAVLTRADAAEILYRAYQLSGSNTRPKVWQ